MEFGDPRNLPLPDGREARGCLGPSDKQGEFMVRVAMIRGGYGLEV